VSYEGRKASFNKAAEQYDAARPSYPTELIECVVARSGIGPDSRILEVGAGTGKASVLFAQRGFQMLCLEPGEVMGDIARRNLGRYPDVEVLTSTFEDWPLQESAFDLAISAQAFHWIDPEIGFPKTARALKAGGWLAFFWNLPTDPKNDLWDEIQSAYVLHAADLTRCWDVKSLTQEVEEIEGDFAKHASLFTSASIDRFPWSRPYSAEEYIQLLGTYSDHIALDEESRNRLFAAIENAISKHGGFLDKRYTTVLQMAQKA
jgi:SAM-dependent methyltransferase